MRRYIFQQDPRTLPRRNFDVVIVGAGVAGLYAALNLDERLSCVILNKTGMRESNSMYAQGGIAAAFPPLDSPEKHLEDTLFAGAGMCGREAVRVLVTEGPGDIEKLISLKVPFDMDEEGHFFVTREGAHSENRIFHSGGDATGLHMTQHLSMLAASRPNITILNDIFLVDILGDKDGNVAGIVAYSGGEYTYFAASRVILATGGIGRVYRNSTNFRGSTGDGIAAGLRMGAAVKDMEFVQFHPTALIHPDNNGRFFLISEALRGEGAVLRNRKWERFMLDEHPLADLAPRDIVSRAIVKQMRKYDLPYVYLDITSKSRDFLRERFPTIYYECMRRGIDIVTEWIPVMPVQHYFMGGLDADLYSRTTVPGLYACGETARTGVHGANRLASNSLLECLVFGRRAAEDINNSRISSPAAPEPHRETVTPLVEEDVRSYHTEIRKLMTLNCGILRNYKDMSETLARVTEIYEILDKASLVTTAEMEAYNVASVAIQILKAAIARKESVGAHYRTDAGEGNGENGK